MTTYPERATLQKFLILNFLDIIALIGDDKERVLSLLKDIRKQFDENKIENNKVVGCDNNDTAYVFEIYSQKDEFYNLEFIGAAK